MITTLTGMLTGLFKNFIWVGYSMVEALIFMWVFNFIAPELIVWGLTLPVLHIGYKFSLALFLSIGFIGSWIGTLTPKIISINNSTKTEKTK